MANADMELNQQQKKWASKPHQRVPPKKLQEILIKQEGRCNLSDVKIIFDTKKGTPKSGGRGCHPLYPAVDHIDPGNPDGGYQIVCYALNDFKGHLSLECFKALRRTKAWRMLMDRWRKQAVRDKSDIEAFKRLLRPNAKQKKTAINARRQATLSSPCRARTARRRT